MTKNNINKIGFTMGLILLLLCIFAVIVGVIWTASTGQSGQRVYLGSAVIAMCLFLLVLWARYIYHGNIYSTYSSTSLLYYPGVLGLPFISIIVLAVGFFITAIITISTGNSTDSLPYLISAVVSLAVLLIVLPILFPTYLVN